MNKELQLINQFKKILIYKNIIIKTLFLFIVMGFFNIYTSPRLYTASSIFIPQSSNSNNSNDLSGLASLAELIWVFNHQLVKFHLIYIQKF